MPTGVELAAELHDLMEQDVSRLFSRELLKFVSIKIIDLQDYILSSCKCYVLNAHAF